MKLGVLIYLEDKKKRILMIHREKEDEHKGLWLAPGGKIESNEAPIEAAIREMEEETGLKIKNPQMKAILSFPDNGDSPFGDEWHVFVFYSKKFSGILSSDCPEGRLVWVPKANLANLPVWEGDLIFTPKIFEPGYFLAKFIYSGKKLLDHTIFSTQ